MTREEALTILKYNSKVIHQTVNGETDPNEVEALDMAINALEEPSVKDVLNKVRAEIISTLYIDSLIFGELLDFRDRKIDADDVIEEFNRITRLEVLRIIDKCEAESEE